MQTPSDHAFMDATEECPQPQIEWPSDLPEAGFHRGVAFDDYRAWPAISQSVIKYGQTSMLHMKAASEGRLTLKRTDAINFGAALHCWLFERTSFADQYPIATPCQATLKSGKNAGAKCGKVASYRDGADWYCGTHARSYEAQYVETRLSQDQLSSIERIADTISTHEVVRLLASPGGSEVSVAACVDGVPAKGRFDRYIDAIEGKIPPTIIDVKKLPSGEGTRRSLQRRIRNYGYDLQAAWYTHMAHLITGETHRFVWLFVEDSEPFDIAVYEASQDMIDLGAQKWMQVLSQYQQCQKYDIWQGYTPFLEVIEPEDFEKKQLKTFTGE